MHLLNRWGHLSAAVKVEKPVLFLSSPCLSSVSSLSLSLSLLPSLPPSLVSLSPLLNDLGRLVTSTSWSWLEAEPRAKFAEPLVGPGPAVQLRPLAPKNLHRRNSKFLLTFHNILPQCENVVYAPVVNL